MEEINISLPIYDCWRGWVKNCRDHKVEWAQIKNGNSDSNANLENFIKNKIEMDYFEPITVDVWNQIVDSEYKAEQSTKEMEVRTLSAQINDEGQESNAQVSSVPQSSWQLYKKSIVEIIHKAQTNEMEQATLRILRKLSVNTLQLSAIKGLVVGNVQSGKTANMAALMAMGADNGFNMFIILSGVIESLRSQTQNRMLKDLRKNECNLYWRCIEHPTKSKSQNKQNKELAPDATNNLDFGINSNQRYFTVCLKNSTRLKNLIEWLQQDSNTQKNMKIVVIDDESDQASINTDDIESGERKVINKLITNLVNGKTVDGKELSVQYKAMNYIGYTATPYANVLNECSEESLYPKNFIATLSVSDKYFGPQQIFGFDGSDYNKDGLSIINELDSKNLKDIDEIHKQGKKTIPSMLEDSICWFLCCVSCQRLWNYGKPVSMLIHTSQKVQYHKRMNEALQNWFKNKTIDHILSNCRNVWEKQTEMFTKEKFHQQYPGYGVSDENMGDIRDYPSFAEIEPELKELLKKHPTYIPLDEDGELTYHEGIHICVDNSDSKGDSYSEDQVVRLVYPDKEHMPKKAPAFIVIGGATLSRGLTIEGLVSTFFMRTTSQADTLMQMGRWFGYREEYELLPRLWISKDTKRKFRELASLDELLRNEIVEMSSLGKKPTDYAIRVKQTQLVQLTSKKKMQSAETSEVDYSGASHQTYLFDNNPTILHENISIMNQFIESLGTYSLNPEDDIISECAIKRGSYVWLDIPFAKVKDFLQSFKFCQRLSAFNNIDMLLEWVEKVSTDPQKPSMGNWNIVIPQITNKNSVEWPLCDDFPNVEKLKLKMSNRSRKISNNKTEDDTINIGVLRSPFDVISDITDADLAKLSQDEKEKVIEEISNFGKKIKSNADDENTEEKEDDTRGPIALRSKAGLNSTPQLIFYMVNQNSEYKNKDKEDSSNEKKKDYTRGDLNAPEHLAAMSMVIPGDKHKNYVKSVAIKLPKNNTIIDDIESE